MEIMSINLAREAQIVVLQADKALTKVLAGYLDDANIFFPDLVMKLPKNMGINKYVIKLVYRKQLLYGLIYALSPVKLETLKAYM